MERGVCLLQGSINHARPCLSALGTKHSGMHSLSGWDVAPTRHGEEKIMLLTSQPYFPCFRLHCINEVDSRQGKKKKIRKKVNSADATQLYTKSIY